MNTLAALYLAVFAAMAPRAYQEDPGRLAITAVAAQRAHNKLLPKWRYGPKQLMGAITSALTHESGFDKDVHSGKNSKNGNCLMQIHHTNGLWKRKMVGAPSFGSLLGTDLQATTWCILNGGYTLVVGANHCHKRRFYKYWQRAMWTMYATGQRCNPWSRQAAKRSRLQYKVARTSWKVTREHHKLIEGVLENEQREEQPTKPTTPPVRPKSGVQNCDCGCPGEGN